MKKLLTVLIMLIFGFVAVANEVVVMTSNDTLGAFNRMYSVGTTQEVVFVENKELFNQIAVPTYASAQVDGNKIAFVRGNDEFSSYAVKFNKEIRTTYVFVSSDESDSTENLVEFETTSKVINIKITDDIVVEETLYTIDTEVPVKIEENPIKGLIHFGTLVSITLLLSFGRISLKTSLRKKVENNINVGYTISKDLVISDVSVKKHKATRYIPGTGYLPVITNRSNLKVAKNNTLIKGRLKAIIKILMTRLKLYDYSIDLIWRIRMIVYSRLKIIHKNKFQILAKSDFYIVKNF